MNLHLMGMVARRSDPAWRGGQQAMRALKRALMARRGLAQ